MLIILYCTNRLPNSLLVTFGNLQPLGQMELVGLPVALVLSLLASDAVQL